MRKQPGVSTGVKASWSLYSISERGEAIIKINTSMLDGDGCHEKIKAMKSDGGLR
jgi:hypothetical protein